jgi:hypothetical protein
MTSNTESSKRSVPDSTPSPNPTQQKVFNDNSSPQWEGSLAPQPPSLVDAANEYNKEMFTPGRHRVYFNLNDRATNPANSVSTQNATQIATSSVATQDTKSGSSQVNTTETPAKTFTGNNNDPDCPLWARRLMDRFATVESR